MKKKRTEVTIETDEFWVIRRLRGSALAWCADCGKNVTMIPADEAVFLSRPDARLMSRWVDERRVHKIEIAEGNVLICLKSLVELVMDEADSTMRIRPCIEVRR